MVELTIKVSERVFTFNDFSHWLNEHRSLSHKLQISKDRLIMVDQNFRVCANSSDFYRAKLDNTFPVNVYNLL